MRRSLVWLLVVICVSLGLAAMVAGLKGGTWLAENETGYLRVLGYLIWGVAFLPIFVLVMYLLSRTDSMSRSSTDSRAPWDDGDGGA